MDFKERLELELKELKEKSNKLENFVYDTEKFSKVSPIQQSLLRVQLNAMYTYEICLEERLANL